MFTESLAGNVTLTLRDVETPADIPAEAETLALMDDETVADALAEAKTLALMDGEKLVLTEGEIGIFLLKEREIVGSINKENTRSLVFRVRIFKIKNIYLQ